MFTVILPVICTPKTPTGLLCQTYHDLDIDIVLNQSLSISDKVKFLYLIWVTQLLRALQLQTSLVRRSQGCRKGKVFVLGLSDVCLNTLLLDLRSSTLTSLAQ